MVLPKSIFLADDDQDDVGLFEEALSEISNDTKLTTAGDGNEILELLHKNVPPPPYAIFLDLNMPRKTGFECLREIKQTSTLKDVPVIILSTAGNQDAIDRTYKDGAHYYIKKPSTFAELKNVIQKILSADWNSRPLRENFCL